jgi:uncharacterized membrane protein HdeD (DUF308 family)
MENEKSEVAAAVNEGGKNMTFFGVIAIILGVLAMLAPGVAGLSVSVMLGILALIAGGIRMMWAFKTDSLGKGILVFALGGLTLICGLILVSDPIAATGMLTLLLAGYFLVDGIFEIVAGFKMRPAVGSGWMIFAGIMSALLGVLIWRQFPLSGFWAIGTLLGIKLFFIGLTMIMTGSAVRSLAKD